MNSRTARIDNQAGTVESKYTIFHRLVQRILLDQAAAFNHKESTPPHPGD